MILRFKLTDEHLELNPWLANAGYVAGDVFEIDVRNVAEGRVGPRPGDRNKTVSDEQPADGE